MHIIDAWQDASLGFSTVDLAGTLHPRLGAGSSRYPALVQHRFSATKPDASDFGEPLGVEGLKFRRVTVPEGMRLWLRTHVSQHDLLVERSAPSAAARTAPQPVRRKLLGGATG